MTLRLAGHLDHRYYTKGRFELEDQRDRRESMSFFRGDTIGPIEVQVFDKANVPVDITPYFLKMTLKRYVWDDFIIYQIDSAVPEDQALIYKYNAPQGVLQWVIPPEVSETFPPETYQFDVQLYIPADPEPPTGPPVPLFRRTVIRSALIIKQDITTDGVITG
jgi:hypothetical protein